MKKVKFLILVFIIGIITSCAQNANSKNGKNFIEREELPNNFLNSVGNISANKKGVIHMEMEYLIKNNDIGNAEIYMIHKNGGKWWINQAKKFFPKKAYPHDWFIDSIFKNQDSIQLTDYNKWVFFIDKKYLERRLESAEGGEFTSHYPKKNAEIDIVLYEQKSGTSIWTAIDAFTYKTDAEGNEINIKNDRGYYYGPASKWESGFIDDRVIEGN